MPPWSSMVSRRAPWAPQGPKESLVVFSGQAGRDFFFLPVGDSWTSHRQCFIWLHTHAPGSRPMAMEK